MGFRFQRRIKISKGMHLNLSKSGIGMSVGPRGFGASTGPRGSILHAGIPGTGLSYRSNLGVSSVATSSRTSPTSVYKLIFDEQHKVRIVSPTGEYINDNDITAKRIKRSDEYKNAVKEFNRQTINEVSENTTKMTDIFKNSPNIVNKEYLQGLLQRSPQVYEKKQFPEPYPTNESCTVLLTAKPSFLNLLIWAIFSKSKASYIKNNLPKKLNQEITRWNKSKADFDAKEEEHLTNTENANREMEAENREITERLKGDKSFIMDSIARIYGEITLPVDFSVNADYDAEKHTAYLDIDLPEIETMPNKKATELSGGKLSVKDKTSKELKYDYSRCVVGMAFYLSALAFNVSTNIEKIIVSGYTQRVSSKTGNTQDDYVYSVIFDRNTFSNLNFKSIEPVDAITNFEHKSNISATFEMKTIQPFTVEHIGKTN